MLVYVFLCRKGVGGKRNKVDVKCGSGDRSLQFPLLLTP